MAVKTSPFGPAEFLDSPEARAEYMSAALESGDPAVIADALGVVARAKGTTQIAKESGLGRESLYKALSATGNPEFGTIMRVVGALGLKPAAAPADPGSAHA